MAERIVDAPPVIGNPWWDPVFDQWPGYFNDPSPYYTPDYNAPWEPPLEQPEAAPAPAPTPAPPPQETPLDEVVVTAPRPQPRPPLVQPSAPILVAPVLPVVPNAADAAFLAAIPNPGRPSRRAPRRRRTPAPRRTRPVRPLRTVPRTLPPIFPRPRPGDPPVPRFLTTALRGIARLGGLIGGLLVPLPAGPREFDEDYGQPRLFGVDSGERRRDDDLDFVRDDFSDLRVTPTPLDEVVVRGTRPSPLDSPALDAPGFASPGLRFDPLGMPGLEPFDDVAPGPGRNAAPRESPAPEPLNAPQPFAPPSPAPAPDAALDPFPLPEPAPAPRPSPRPDLDVPSYFAPPGTGAPGSPIIGNIIPMPEPGPFPKPELDKCNCKPKQSKKRKPREVCYRGSYRETRSSTRKAPREAIDCDTGKPI